MEKCDQEMLVKVSHLPMLQLAVVYDVLSAKEENGSFEQEEQANALQYENGWELDCLLGWPMSRQLLDAARPPRRLLRQSLHCYGHLEGVIGVPVKV